MVFVDFEYDERPAMRKRILLHESGDLPAMTCLAVGDDLHPLIELLTDQRDARIGSKS